MARPRLVSPFSRRALPALMIMDLWLNSDHNSVIIEVQAD